MRLTQRQQQTIREEVTRVFGQDALVRLFGSRVDNHARGGDIDLHIESQGTPAELFNRELQLQARLLRKLGDRRIDIIVCGNKQQPRPIDIQARETGVAL